MIPRASKEGRQGWLDGLRGTAAAIVAWFHFTVGEMHIPYRGFGDTPAEQNRYLIQLPPFRILFAGKAMVPLFFVISGYSLPLAIIRLRGQNNNVDCYRKLTSSVLRRGFRLYVPVLIVCMISQVLFFVGAYYSWFFPEGEGCPGAAPWSSIRQHFKCFASAFLSALGFVDPTSASGLNSQLWTMLVELRGSLAIYLTTVGLLSVTHRVRMTTIALLAFLFLWFGFHESFCFFSGLLFAELDLLNHSLPSFSVPVTQTVYARRPKRSLTATLALFVVGAYLLCLPYREDHDDWYSSEIGILPFWDYPGKRITSWFSVGAVMVVGAIRNLPSIKKVLESPIAQFSGEISFSLYLIHQTIIRIFRGPILETVCWRFWGKGFGATRDDEAGSHVYYLSWMVAAAFIGPLLFISATLMTRTIDRRSIVLAYQLEERLSGR
ncbi:acyltransferase 3 [Aspergillus cavernicola]|uniref:Acyltransferase 3 n=1 Tax=Aspergillus cavernicola TaxID=176166 RepID=A0ABR4IXD0_9EURO